MSYREIEEPPRHKLFRVKTAKGRPVKVLAEYYRVQDGVLTFRDSVPGNYPLTVHVFAPGHWLEISQGE